MKQRIPTLEDFINESVKLDIAKNNKVVKDCNYILQKNIDHDADDYHKFKVPLDWNIYNHKISVKRKDKGKPSACYDNALFFAQKNPEYKLVIGFFIYTDWIEEYTNWVNKDVINKVNPFLYMYMHAWNVTKDNEIYDITIDNDLSRTVYVGIEVDPSKFKTGFGDVNGYLSKLIYKK